MTVDQIRYRRGLSMYKVMLRMFRNSFHLLEPVSQISPATPSSHSPVPCSSPTPITSSSADLTVEDPPGCLVGSKPISLPLRSPCTTEVPTTPYRQDRSSSRSPYTTEVPTTPHCQDRSSSRSPYTTEVHTRSYLPGPDCSQIAGPWWNILLVVLLKFHLLSTRMKLLWREF